MKVRTTFRCMNRVNIVDRQRKEKRNYQTEFHAACLQPAELIRSLVNKKISIILYVLTNTYTHKKH